MKITKRILKIIGYTLLGLLLVLVLGLFLLSRPSVQQRLTGSIERFLEKKIGTEVGIERVLVRFPKSLVLEGVQVEDERGDTLVYLGSLAADVRMMDLLKNKITIRSVFLENTTATITKSGGRSNFDFILEAFAQPPDTLNPPDTTAAPWVVDIAPATFWLGKVNFTLNDEDAQQFIAARIGTFEAKTDSADLTTSRFVFKNVALGDSRISFRQLAPPKDTVATATTPFFLALRNADISNSSIYYETTTLQLDATLADAVLENLSFSTDADGELVLTAETLQLDDSGNRLAYKALPAPPPTPQNFNPGDFDLRNLAAALRQVSFRQQPVASSTLAGLQTPPTFALSAHVKSLQGQDKSGIEVRALAGELTFTPENLQVANLQFRTGSTNLSGDFSLRMSKTQPLEFFSADLDGGGKIGDLLAFVPPAPNTASLEKLAALPFQIRGKAEGNLNQLKANNLRLAIGQGTKLTVNGNLQNLTTPERMGGDFRIQQLHFEKNDFSKLLASQPMLLPAFADLQGTVSGANGRLTIDLKGQMGKLDSAATAVAAAYEPARFDIAGAVQLNSIFEKTKLDLTIRQLEVPRAVVTAAVPPDMVAPEQISLAGKLAGTLNDLQTDLKLTALRQQKTSTLAVEGNLKNATAPDSLRFDVRFSGEVTKAEILGYVPDSLVTPVLNLPEKSTLDGWVKGSPTNFSAVTNLTLGNRGKLALKGSLRGENYSVKIVAEDLKINQLAADSLLWQAESADFTATAEGKLASANSTGSAVGSEVTAIVEARFDTLVWQGMALRDILVAGSLDGKKFTATLTSTDDRAAVNLSANGDFGRPAPLLEWNGKIECLDLDAFGFTQKESFFCASLQGKLEGLSPDTLAGFVRMQNLRFQYDTARIAPGDLEIVASLQRGVNNISLESDWLRAYVRGQFDPQLLPQTLAAFAYRYFQLPALAKSRSTRVGVTGSHADTGRADSLAFSLEVLKPEIFTAGLIPNLTNLGTATIAGRLNLGSGRMNFDANLPMLEWERWTLHNLSLTANADGKQANLQMRAPRVEQFGENYARNLLVKADFTGEQASAQLVAADTFGGRERFRVGAFFRAEELREGFTLHLATSQVIDYVAWSVPTDNAITLTGSDVRIKNLRLSNEQQAFAIEGSSTLLKDGDRAVDFDLDIERLNLSNLELLLATTVKNLAGWVEGDFQLTGTLKNPQPRGSLTLQEASALFVPTNVRYRFSEEPLRFVPEGIQISAFELTDPDGQKLSLNGFLRTENWLDYRYDLNVSTRNWLALNTRRQIGVDFFGKVYVSAYGEIRGAMLTPEITLTVKPEEDSEFTYIYDQAKLTRSSEGVVVFLSNEPPADERKNRFTTTFPFELNLFLDLNENLQLTVIADPVTGDNFSGTLEGQMTLDIYPNGVISLAGRCEVQQGVYNYSYQGIVRRQFRVVPGSYVSFSGDPYNPDLSVAARYVVKASALPLIGERTNSLTEQEQREIRSLQTFFLNANVNGNLQRQEISFSLEYPTDTEEELAFENPDNEAIENAVNEVNQNETALSQQVFGLLLFKRFVGATAEATTATVDPFRAGLNRFLSSQINALADQYFSFVDVNFEVEEGATFSSNDQMTNTTNYRLQLQRSFLNDRLTFKVSGGTLVERESEQQTSRSSLQDVSVEYALTPAGTLKLRAFSEEGYDFFDADRSRKSGLGVVFSKEFEKFRLRKDKE